MHPKPPPSLLARYRLFAIRLPEQYRPWAVEDTLTRSFLTWRIVRTALFALLLVAVQAGTQRAMAQWPARGTIIRNVLLAVAFALLSSRKTLVRKALAWQRVGTGGAPVAPRRFTLLDNAEAALVVVVAVLLWAGGTAVFGYGLRPPPPTGIAAIPCAPPDPATTSEITGSFSKPGTTIEHARAVPYGGGVVVAALVRVPDQTEVAFAAFLTQGGKMYELSRKDAPALTRHPRPEKTDRVTAEALSRAVTCIAEVMRP